MALEDHKVLDWEWRLGARRHTKKSSLVNWNKTKYCKLVVYNILGSLRSFVVIKILKFYKMFRFGSLHPPFFHWKCQNLSRKKFLREGPASQPQSTLSCWKNFPLLIKNSDPPFSWSQKNRVDHSFQNCFYTWCQNYMVWLSGGCLCPEAA